MLQTGSLKISVPVITENVILGRSRGLNCAGTLLIRLWLAYCVISSVIFIERYNYPGFHILRLHVNNSISVTVTE